jgi:hypothetical protein
MKAASNNEDEQLFRRKEWQLYSTRVRKFISLVYLHTSKQFILLLNVRLLIGIRYTMRLWRVIATSS